ncbi:putative proline permease [Penicillium brasilianum]|uniref:Putative proline permease n=1 Tax=Penicillium brasilianum TaxID=104259 RepID=A0A1S9RKB2_PENBI|nr:putative proline permease [Penicillium brasilianum]
MALGPTLGTGLFIGAGQALAIGGPASLLISYAFLSLLTYFMATTVTEVASHAPARHGTLVTNGFRYMTDSMGFAAGILRWYTLAMFVPYEITTAMVNLGLWNPGVTIALRLIFVMTVVVGSNFIPERHFRTSERIFTRVKVVTMASLLALSLSIGLGGATGHTNWGFYYWKRPGAMHEYLFHGSLGKFLGLLQCVLHSSIAFTFTPEIIVHRVETVELAYTEIGEVLDPTVQASLPSKVAFDVATTTLPYILSSLAMGVMAPYNDPLLTNNGAGAGLSPFVIGINTARVPIVSVTATLAILISSVASARSFLFLASRTLCAMSELGHAHRALKVRNQWGVPYVAVSTTGFFSLLAFASVRMSSSITTTYFLVFVNSSGYLSWLISCVIFHYFRRNLGLRHNTNSYQYAIQPFGTYFGALMSVILLMFNGLVGGTSGPRHGPSVARLLAAYLSIPVFAIVYFAHRFRTMVPYRTSHSNLGVHNRQEEQRGQAVTQVSEPQQGGLAQPVSPEIV